MNKQKLKRFKSKKKLMKWLQDNIIIYPNDIISHFSTEILSEIMSMGRDDYREWAKRFISDIRKHNISIHINVT